MHTLIHRTDNQAKSSYILIYTDRTWNFMSYTHSSQVTKRDPHYILKSYARMEGTETKNTGQEQAGGLGVQRAASCSRVTGFDPWLLTTEAL